MIDKFVKTKLTVAIILCMSGYLINLIFNERIIGLPLFGSGIGLILQTLWDDVE